jgi:hypothetical protein
VADTKTDERSMMGSGSTEAQDEARQAIIDRVGEEAYEADPEMYWTAQQGPMPATGRVLANEPQQFLPEQLPDPEGARNAGLPEVIIPEAQINPEAVGHPNGPEPGEITRINMRQELFGELGGDASDGDEAAPDGEPSDSWTKAELQQYADDNGIEIPSGANKAEMLEAING